MKTKVLFFVLASAFLAMLVMGCEGTVGPTGPKGEPGGGAGGGASVSSAFLGDWTSLTGATKTLSIGSGVVEVGVSTFGIDAGTHLITASTTDSLTVAGKVLKFDAALLPSGILKLTHLDGVEEVSTSDTIATIVTAVKAITFTKDSMVDSVVNAAVSYNWATSATDHIDILKATSGEILVDASSPAVNDVIYTVVSNIVKTGDKLTVLTVPKVAVADVFAITPITFTIGTVAAPIGQNAIVGYTIGDVSKTTTGYKPNAVDLTAIEESYTDKDGATLVISGTDAPTSKIVVTDKDGGAKTYYAREGNALTTGIKLDTGATLTMTAVAATQGVTADTFFTVVGIDGVDDNVIVSVASATYEAALALVKDKFFANKTVATTGNGDISLGSGAGAGIAGMVTAGTAKEGTVGIWVSDDLSTISVLGGTKDTAVPKTDIAKGTVLTLSSPISFNATTTTAATLEVIVTRPSGTDSTIAGGGEPVQLGIVIALTGTTLTTSPVLTHIDSITITENATNASVYTENTANDGSVLTAQ